MVWSGTEDVKCLILRKAGLKNHEWWSITVAWTIQWDYRHVAFDILEGK